MTTDTLGAPLPAEVRPPDSQPTRVQRFDCAGPEHPCEHCDGCYHMEPNTEGDYVRWEDYYRLRALNAELLAMVERYASECAECDGQGNSKLSALHPEECRDCADIRALSARAKGEV